LPTYIYYGKMIYICVYYFINRRVGCKILSTGRKDS